MIEGAEQMEKETRRERQERVRLQARPSDQNVHAQPNTRMHTDTHQ